MTTDMKKRTKQWETSQAQIYDETTVTQVHDQCTLTIVTARVRKWCCSTSL